MTVKLGFTSCGNSAEIIPTTSLPGSATNGVSSLAVPPSPAANVLLSVFWYGVSFRSAAGIQIRVTPTGFSTSILVVSSNVRHLAASAAQTFRAPPNTHLADANPADAIPA